MLLGGRGLGPGAARLELPQDLDHPFLLPLLPGQSLVSLHLQLQDAPLLHEAHTASVLAAAGGR